MSARPTEFDDPQLRSALRRAMSTQPAAAPPSLRLRVESLMTAAAPAMAAANANDVSSGSLRGRWPAWAGESPRKTFAAGIAALIAVSLAGVQIWSAFAPTPRAPEMPPAVFPASVAVEMTRTHDNCAKLPDHHLVPTTNPAVAAEQLSKTEGGPVASITATDGWQFKGAGLCKVGEAQAAHLLFARGNEIVSVFSMPAPHSCGSGASPTYHETVSGHAVGGFVFGGMVYAVVGANDDVTAKDIQPLTAQLATCVGSGSCDIARPAAP